MDSKIIKTIMKEVFALIILTVMFSMMSCANADSMINVYEQGIEDVQKCTTKEELSNLTYRVKEQLMDIANRPGGNKKMSEEDTEGVLDAQERFDRAVEARASQVP